MLKLRAADCMVPRQLLFPFKQCVHHRSLRLSINFIIPTHMCNKIVNMLCLIYIIEYVLLYMKSIPV